MADPTNAEFFISRAGADADAAELIAGIIQDAGRTTFYQNEDFGHASFMHQIERGLDSGARVVALLSQHYQASDYCRAEYNNVLGDDPSNLRQRLIVLRIEECQPTGMLATIAYTDLVPYLTDFQAYRTLVRAALGIDIGRPAIDFLSAHRRHAKVLHEEIRPVRGFSGRRSVLTELRHLLFADGASRDTSVAIHGLGGVGKTVIARQFASENKDDYCGLWWVRAETRATIIEDLCSLGQRLGVVAADAEQTARRVLDWIRQTPSDKPWLFVYDDVADQSLIRTLTPPDNSHILITTRLREWHGEVIELPVGVFDRETAITYLMQQARIQQDTRDAAGRLGDALDYLPLALAHARSFCRASNWRFDQYVERLPELIMGVPRNAPYPHSVFATFVLSLDRAVEESELAWGTIGLIAFFAPDHIPVWLLSEPDTSDIDRNDALAALAGQSLVQQEYLASGERAISVHRLVQQVMRARLVEGESFDQIRNTAARMLRISYASSTVSEEADWFPHAQAFLPHAPTTGSAAQDTIWINLNLGEFLLSRGDSDAALECFDRAMQLASRPLELLPGSDLFTLDVKYELLVAQGMIGDVYRERGNHSAALKSYQAMAATAEDVALIRGGASPGAQPYHQAELLRAYMAVGDLQRSQGNIAEAIKSYEVGTALATSMPNAVESLEGYDDVFVIIRERLEEARHSQSDSNAIQTVSAALKKAYDELALLDDRAQFESHLGQGDIYREQGNLSAALRSYRACLAAADDAVWTRVQAVAYVRIGDTLRFQGSLGPAFDALRLGVDLAAEDVSANPDLISPQSVLAAAWDGLGDVQLDQHNLPGSLDSYNSSMAIRKKLAALDPSSTTLQRALSISHDKIGNVLRSNDSAGALKSYQESLAIVERLVRRDPKNTEWQNDLSVSLDQVGQLQIAQGDFAHALASYKRKLRIDVSLEKSDVSNAKWSSNLLVSYEQLGALHRRLGDLDQAVENYRKKLAIQQRFVQSFPTEGGHVVGLAKSLVVVGDIENERGHGAAAAEIYQRARMIFEALVPSNPNNNELLRLLSALLMRIGHLRLDQDELDQALATFVENKEIAERQMAASADDVEWQRVLMASLTEVGNVCVVQGNLAGAVESFEERMAIARQRATSDPDNAEWQRELSEAYSSKGAVLLKQGHTSAARDAFTTALSICQKQLERGPNDIQTRLSSVFPLMRLGDLDGANGRDNLESALDILEEAQSSKRVNPVLATWSTSIKTSLRELDKIERIRARPRSQGRSFLDRLLGR